MSEKWFGFDGDWKCEECRGWDGVSDRCDCYRARVHWDCLLGSEWCDQEEADCSICPNSYTVAD